MPLPAICPDATYRGKPYICNADGSSPLTAITLRPRVSNVTGTVPFPVHVTMLECLMTGPVSGNAYMDLEYTVNFGDGSGTQRFTHPHNGATLNPNSDQVGPEAFYVYNTPGTYTITVTARGWNGTQMITATSTTVVQGSSASARVIGGTVGTYTLRAQNAAHARSLRITQANMSLVRPAGHAIVPSSTGFMVAGWFKIRGGLNTLYQTIAGTYSDAQSLGAGQSWRLWYSNIGQIALSVGKPGTSTPAIVTSTESGLGTTGWHHVVAWCDTTGTIGVAIDGGTPTTAVRAANPMTIPANVPFAISGFTSAANTVTQPFYGNLDEVAFWNRPPQAGEIAWLYNSGAGRHHGDIAVSAPPSTLTTGLVAWWTLDEPGGPVWSDATGNGHALQEGLVLASGTKPQVGMAGDIPKIYRPGGVTTAPIAWNAGTAPIAAAVATAMGLTSKDVYRDGEFAVRFGGSIAGQPWTLAPGTTAGGFDGVLQVLGESNGASASSVTATAWPSANYPEVYFDSNAAAGGDGSAGAPYNLATNLAATLGLYGGGRWVRIAAGSSFTMASGVSTTILPIAPMLVQKWGTGADPSLSCVDSGTMCSVKAGADDALRGMIFDRITMLTPNSTISSAVNSPTTTMALRREGFYTLNCTLGNVVFNSFTANIGSPYMDCVGVYGGSITGGTPGPGGKPTNLGFGSGSFGVVMGVSISGGGLKPGGGGRIFCHHIYDTPEGCSSLKRWIAFGQSAVDPATGIRGELNFCLKGNAFGPLSDPKNGPPVERRGHLVDGCLITGTSNTCGFGRHNGDELMGNAYRELVLSDNSIGYTPPVYTQGLGPYFPDVYSLTLRDNKVWATNGLDLSPSFPAYAPELSVYRNKVHGNNDVAGSSGLIKVKDPGRITMTDNIVVDLASSTAQRGVVAMISYSAALAAGTITIDRNQYDAPNRASGQNFYEANPTITTKTFPQWQALGFDTNSSLANPGWTSPSTGDFSTLGAAPASTVDGVNVSPTTASLAPSGTQQFSATVTGTNSPSQLVTWATTLGTVSAFGLYTAPSVIATSTTATITATSAQSGTFMGSATISLSAGAAPPPPPTNLRAVSLTFVFDNSVLTISSVQF